MKILLVYTGTEQGAWGAIAFPRPQHYYIMPGILYCAAALRASDLFGTHDEVACRYFNTTVQGEAEILEAILDEKPDVAGFSCYCWNVDVHRRLMTSIKARLPAVMLICGGPEVGFSSAPEVRSFFTAAPECDALLFGEAELRIAPLIKAMAGHGEPLPAGLTGFAFNPARFGDVVDFSVAAPASLDDIPSPYPFDVAIPLSPDSGRAMVYETVRGCPYKCIYCQFSHRSHAVRKFPPERLYAELDWLLRSGVECLHIADSVFDLEVRRACDLLTFFRDHNRKTSLFCYCSFMKLDKPLAALFEETRAQIGVGVQSTNPEALRRIERTVAPSRLIEKSPLLQGGRINFYVDLMFGLPGDSPLTFANSFNDTVKLSPSFMMLFPLSLISGTPLAEDARRYGVRPVDTGSLDLLCDIRYDNIALSTDFTAHDLERFDDMALSCFYFYNRFALSLGYLMKRSPDPAATVAVIGGKTKEFLHSVGRTATNTDWLEGFQETIHTLFLEQAKVLGAGPVECSAFDDLFKLDIYRILAISAPQREKIFRRLDAVREYPLRVRPLRAEPGCSVHLVTAGKTIRLAYRWNDLCALEKLRESIVPASEAVFLHSAFEDWDARITPLSPLERGIIELVPAERPILFDHLQGPALRRAKKLSPEGDAEAGVARAIAGLARAGILYLSPGGSHCSRSTA
ncbi:MAG: radical SAM protein [Chitinispirillaceae bacterium]|nr:radical SAM protein [Chitinispirillaceae bacterium]